MKADFSFFAFQSAELRLCLAVQWLRFVEKSHIVAKGLHNTDTEKMKDLLFSFHWPRVVFVDEIHVHCCDEIVSKANN